MMLMEPFAITKDYFIATLFSGDQDVLRRFLASAGEARLRLDGELARRQLPLGDGQLLGQLAAVLGAVRLLRRVHRYRYQSKGFMRTFKRQTLN